MAQMVQCLPIMWETQIPSLGWEDLLEKKWQRAPVFLPGKSHGRRNLVGYSPWGCEESERTEQLHFHSHLHGPKERIPDTKGWLQANEPELWSTRSWRLFPKMRWEPRRSHLTENLVQSSLCSLRKYLRVSLCGRETAAHQALVNNSHKRFSSHSKQKLTKIKGGTLKIFKSAISHSLFYLCTPWEFCYNLELLFT